MQRIIPEQEVQVDLVEIVHMPEWKSLLLDLIRENKMDPWQINVSVLSQKYLEKIHALKEQSLRIPANCILVCAILLKAKAKTIKLIDVDEEIFREDERQKILEEIRAERLKAMSELPEIVSNCKQRETVMQLEDLLGAIESILSKTRKIQPTAKQLEELKFLVPEIKINIEELTEEVFEKIKICNKNGEVILFSELTTKLEVLEKINYFIACLFLCNKEKIELWQEEFFGEIFINLINN